MAVPWLLEELIITFAMYSIIPTPRLEWRERNMRLTLGLFPLVGAVIAAGLLGLAALRTQLGFPGVSVTAFLLTGWPILLSGGLHLDGFADTADALGSHRDRETRLKIMKDPHAGPFAVICCILVLLLQFACWSDLLTAAADRAPAADLAWLLSIALIPVAARIMAGLGVCLLPPARPDGLVKVFHDRLAPAAIWLLVLEALLVAAAWLLLDPVAGLASLLTALTVGFGCGWMSKRAFGGTTGDLTGFTLILGETALLLVQTLAGAR